MAAEEARPLLEGAHPILDGAQAREWERQILGDEERRAWEAMQQAGRGVAAGILADVEEIGGLPVDARFLVLCGKGNNGGDALIALQALLAARTGARALVLLVPGFSVLGPLVRRAMEELARRFGDRIEWVCVDRGVEGTDAARIGPRLTGIAFDVCLDGLFGLQFRPPLRAPADWLLDLVNAHPNIRLRAAVDVPSGVGDAGDPRGFRADFTYATGILKAPVWTGAERELAGRVRYLDLGFFPTEQQWPEVGRAVLTAGVLDPLRRPRPAQADKRSFGHLFIVSGSLSMPGAVLMAVESALLSGAGLVTAFVPETLASAFAARLPEAMWVPMPETPAGGLALEGRGSVIARAARCTALLAGPGLGRERESLVLIAELVRELGVAVVLDGDALQTEVVGARKPGAEDGLVLTPHAGEFARISGDRAFDDEALRQTARRLRAAVVLKGAPTRISTGEVVYYSPFGGPVLSRGGSGDVLAGLVGSQLAQGLPPLEAAARAVVWHGRAADLLARAQAQGSARVTGLTQHFAAALEVRGR